MPTYEYKCKSCGKMCEFFQSMTARHIKKCPHCEKNALERQIGTGAAIVFKGSGFYQTDYRSDSYKKAAEADSKSSAPATSDSKPSDSKSAESKAGENKSGESKSGDGKSSEPKSESAKPEPKPAHAERSSTKVRSSPKPPPKSAPKAAPKSRRAK